MGLNPFSTCAFASPFTQYKILTQTQTLSVNKALECRSQQATLSYRICGRRVRFRGTARCLWRWRWRRRNPSSLGPDCSPAGRGSHLYNGNKKITKHGKDATEHGNDATEHGNDATEHGNDATEHGKDATEHGKDATEHGKDATEHGKDATEHGKDATEHGKDATETR